MELSEATLQQLLDEVFERSTWIGLVLQADDLGTLIVCQGANGFEILGGIEMLHDSQVKAIRAFLLNENVPHR